MSEILSHPAEGESNCESMYLKYRWEKVESGNSPRHRPSVRYTTHCVNCDFTMPTKFVTVEISGMMTKTVEQTFYAHVSIPSTMIENGDVAAEDLEDFIDTSPHLDELIEEWNENASIEHESSTVEELMLESLPEEVDNDDPENS